MAKTFARLILLLLLVGCGKRLPEHDPLTGGNAKKGKELISYFGCGSCHEIRGIPGADATVAPSLTDLRKRVYIAGRLPNTPRALEQWIVDPRSINPHTAMPRVGADVSQARDIAAYLYHQ